MFPDLFVLIVRPEAVRVDELDVDEILVGSECEEDAASKGRDKRGSAAEASQHNCSCKIHGYISLDVIIAVDVIVLIENK